MQTTRKTRKEFASQGFSLVELMVSLTVFSIVMVASISTLLTLVDANAKAQALYNTMTNLSFAVDSMSRNIRTAYDYLCLDGTSNSLNNVNLPTGASDCAAGNTAIVFTREKDKFRVGYRLTGNTIYQRVEGVASDQWLPITASSTKVTTFKVVVQGSTASDASQPQISLLIKGYVNNGLDTATDFALQNNVTERILNY